MGDEKLNMDTYIVTEDGLTVVVTVTPQNCYILSESYFGQYQGGMELIKIFSKALVCMLPFHLLFSKL